MLLLLGRGFLSGRMVGQRIRILFSSRFRILSLLLTKETISVNGPTYCLWDYKPCGGEEANPLWNHLTSFRDLQLGNGILSRFHIYCFKTTVYGVAATKLKTATESSEVGIWILKIRNQQTKESSRCRYTSEWVSNYRQARRLLNQATNTI